MTIPQTNFKLGYFINDHYSIALGADHMKYVVTQDQTGNITGTIAEVPLMMEFTIIHNCTYREAF
jgi:hypothetical protein